MSEARPSETAQAVAQLVPALCEQDARDLGALLALLTAADKPGALRAERLGLLLELVDGQGTFPLSSDYDELRRQRASRAEDWPDHATLCRSYGSWLGAVKAAMAHLHSLGRPVSYQRFGTEPRYTTVEMLEAVRACRAALAPWPSPHDWPRMSEYAEYRRLTRRAASCSGQPVPRLPSAQVIGQRLGSWDEAVRMARSPRAAATH